jgi:sugar phosphate isomerase/epimerase
MKKQLTRRDFGRFAAAGIPLASLALSGSDLFAQGKPNSNFAGVHIGVITYSFNGLAATDIIPTMVRIGLSNCELMSNHAETLAGMPAMGRGGFGGAPGGGRGPETYPQTIGPDGLTAACEARVQAMANGGGARGGAGGFPGRGPLTPEQQAAMADAQKKTADWRASTTTDTWKSLRKQFDDAGIDLRILCYNMATTITDDEIDYAFRMARDLRVQAISSTSTVPVAKRVAPFADKYKMMWGGHGHDNLTDPNEFAKPETFKEIMSFSPYIGVNLDIGHFTAAGYDPVSYIKENHARITNIHLKDRKKNTDVANQPGGIMTNNYPWGQGGTPIKEVLLLMKAQNYPWPADIEYEYECRAAGSPADEVAKSLAFAKQVLEG